MRTVEPGFEFIGQLIAEPEEDRTQMHQDRRHIVELHIIRAPVTR